MGFEAFEFGGVSFGLSVGLKNQDFWLLNSKPLNPKLLGFRAFLTAGKPVIKEPNLDFHLRRQLTTSPLCLCKMGACKKECYDDDLNHALP